MVGGGGGGGKYWRKCVIINSFSPIFPPTPTLINNNTFSPIFPPTPHPYNIFYEGGLCCATYMSNIMHSLIINPGFAINRVTRHQ
jgi:hypothetical protein